MCVVIIILLSPHSRIPSPLTSLSFTLSYGRPFHFPLFLSHTIYMGIHTSHLGIIYSQHSLQVSLKSLQVIFIHLAHVIEPLRTNAYAKSRLFDWSMHNRWWKLFINFLIKRMLLPYMYVLWIKLIFGYNHLTLYSWLTVCSFICRSQ